MSKGVEAGRSSSWVHPGHTASCVLGCSQLGVSRGRTPVGGESLCSPSLQAVARSPQGGELGAPTPLWGRTFPRSHAGEALGKARGGPRGWRQSWSLCSPFSITHSALSRPGSRSPAAELRGKWLREPPLLKPGRVGHATWTPAPCGPCHERGDSWVIILCLHMGCHLSPNANYSFPFPICGALPPTYH